MNTETIDYALHVLDTQRSYTTVHDGITQEAYYKGMRTMLELIMTEGYRNGNMSLEYNEVTGEHMIRIKNGGKYGNE